MSTYIGIDLGTSSVKTVLIGENGNARKEAETTYRFAESQPGYKEIDPEIWWEAAVSTLKRLLDGEDAAAVRGIGVTGQMHTVVVLDAAGSPIRPALMWNDTRTKDLVPALKEAAAATDVPYIAGILSTGSPAANLRWFALHEPENFAKLAHFLIGPDYIVYRLTGEYGTDYCEASTSSLYDITGHKWSEAMRQIVGLPEGVYPPVRGSAEVVGTLNAAAAEKLGLSRTVKVIAGTGDNPAAAIPTGCLGKRTPVFSLGTSGVLMLPRTAPDFAAKGKNILFSFDSQKFFTLVQGVVQSTGSSYSWWNTDILGREDFGSADKGIDIARLGEDDLFFYPHLTGDKTIYADPSLRGAFLGLGTETSRADMTRAVMEGVAFALGQLVSEMHVHEELREGIKIIGGGAKSKVWAQIIADVLNLPVERLEGNVGAGYGMALLAAHSCGAIASIENISEQAVRVKDRFEPRAYNAALYEEKMKKYLRIHDALKAVYRES